MRCSTCGYESPVPGQFCSQCGAVLVTVTAQPGPVNAYDPPKTLSFADAPMTGPTEEGDATGGIIPYKNPKALIAYYLGILSGLPLIGFPIGIAAFVLGIQGLKARRRNPKIKGSLHAGVGIGCGLIFTLFWGAVIIAIVVSIVSNGGL